MAASITTHTTLDRVCEPVREGLDRSADRLRSLAAKKEPLLVELLDHVLQRTGKRLRPTITLLATGFHPTDGRTAEIMATAVELLHVATLVHDDTVDEADTRRGRPTVSSRWGTTAAVLVGDYIFAASATLVCDTENIRVIKRFAETIMELSRGELEESAGVYDAAKDMGSYLDRIYNKTASLFTTAAESGAILSGAGEDIVARLRGYGYNVGMAYQIVDDILDFEGDPEEFGKPVGQDLAHGILTLPALIAMERGNGASPIFDYLNDPEDQRTLAAAVAAASDSSVIEEAYAHARDYGVQAVERLAGLDRNAHAESLEMLVGYVLERRS